MGAPGGLTAARQSKQPQNEQAFAQEWCKSGANHSTPAKGKARDLIEITGLFWLREPDLN
jgi:hypothetical protein